MSPGGSLAAESETSLFARALAGGDVVASAFYRLRSGEDFLRPREMPAEKVVASCSRVSLRAAEGMEPPRRL